MLAAPPLCIAAPLADSPELGEASAPVMRAGSAPVQPVAPGASKVKPDYHSLVQSPSAPIIIPAGDLTLEQAIKIAIANHPKMKEAAAETDAAGDRIGEARSYLGPQIYGTAQYLRSTENGIGNASYYDPEGAFPRMTGINHDRPDNDFSQSWDTSNNYMGGIAMSQFLFDFGRGMAGYAGMGTGLPAANNFNAGVVITWPIFNSFLTRDQIAEADSTRHSIEAAIEDLRQQIILQVQTAFLNWQDAAQRIQFARRALDASRVELELAQKRYETGLTDIVELEDAERHYTEDDANYANALYGFALTKAAVDQATARSLRDWWRFQSSTAACKSLARLTSVSGWPKPVAPGLRLSVSSASARVTSTIIRR